MKNLYLILLKRCLINILLRGRSKKDFQEYFRELTPKEVYPDKDEQAARMFYDMDYCLSTKWEPGCNEITFLNL